VDAVCGNLRGRDLESDSCVAWRNQSRRDPTKVAQHLSAGLRFLKAMRPGWDDRWLLALPKPRARSRAERSIVPHGTDVSFASFPSNKLLGYFRWVPPGRVSWHTCKPHIHALGRPPGDAWLPMTWTSAKTSERDFCWQIGERKLSN
jgi:hypothetical protein